MLLMASGSHAQKKKEQAMVCRTGLTYEISQKINWGKGKPVVIDVTPYSSAERASEIFECYRKCRKIYMSRYRNGTPISRLCVAV